MLRSLVVPYRAAGGRSPHAAERSGIFWYDLMPPWSGQLDALPREAVALLTTASSQHARLLVRGPYACLTFTGLAQEAEGVRSCPVRVLLGPRIVVTARTAALPSLDRAWARVQEPGSLRRADPLAVAYLVLDALVEDYFPVLEGLGEKLAELERQVVFAPRHAVLEEILDLRRRVVELRKVVAGERDALRQLAPCYSGTLSAAARALAAEVDGHLAVASEVVDTLRDLAATALEAYLSTVSNRTNEVMKTLTMIATIMMPLTLISGIYGMNFRIPETQWPNGYYFALGLMAAVSLTMLLYFRWRQWL